MDSLANPAPYPARGGYADGFEAVAQRFARHLRSKAEIGAAFSAYHRGQLVVDLWGGLADRERRVPWRRDTRVVVFSVTKGFAAMGLNLLADRNLLDWDAPVADYWPEFGSAGKARLSLRTLFNHRGGLAVIDEPLSVSDCLKLPHSEGLSRALARQRPAWEAEQDQGYHALTFGLYASEVFFRIAGEPLGGFLRRELFEPLESDVRLGTEASFDDRFAVLYAPHTAARVGLMLSAAFTRKSAEGRIARDVLRRDSLARRAFTNPTLGQGKLEDYNDPPIRRAELAWASATASAGGIARAYLPFSLGGSHGDKRYLRSETLAPILRRQGWSMRDRVLQKPLGWAQGFLKEEAGVFSPHLESFGHAGMGGALGWCDPVSELSFGYVLNRMDWRVRSPRAKALCQALYESEALQLKRV